MRSRTPGALAAALLSTAICLALGISSVPAAGVATDQSYWVPKSRDLVIHGHGYGHGHGMSQYGAQGAARSGSSYRQIVSHYYPGTTMSRKSGRVRVLITADTTSDVVVSPSEGLKVRDRATGAVHRLPASTAIKRWRLDVVNGSTVIEKYTDRWRRFDPRGDSGGTMTGVGEFSADGAVTLWLPDGSTNRYRGILRASPSTGGAATLDTVNALSVDSYLQGVVPYEMPASWHREAVKAQAVAARSYAFWSRDQNKQRSYQICDTTSCQMYGGMGGEDLRSNRAVAATSNEILTYGGEPAFTQSSSSSGGWTAKGSVPYLPAQQDPFDDWAGNSMHAWSKKLTAGAFETKYPRLGKLRRIRVTDRVGHGDWGGRVNRLVLDGTRHDVAMSGDSLRVALGLRSTWFRFS